MKVTDSWYSERLEQPIGLARWGHFGTPVLVFPTAGGDAEEIERNGVVGACWPLIESGRIKLYSCDSVAGQAMVAKTGSPEYRMWLFNQFHHARPARGRPGDPRRHGRRRDADRRGRRLDRGVQRARRALPVPGRVPRRRRHERHLPDPAVPRRPVLAGPRTSPRRWTSSPGSRASSSTSCGSRFAIIASGQGAWEDVDASWDAGARARPQGRAEPGRRVGRGVAARVAHLAADAPAVPRRALLIRSGREHLEVAGERLGHLDDLLQLGMPDDDHAVAGDRRAPVAARRPDRQQVDERRRARRTGPAARRGPRSG